MTNTPTETLAERLREILGMVDRTDESLLVESASRLLAQHATMTKQDERIAELERQLAEMTDQCQSWADSSRDWKAKAERYWQELAEAQHDAESWKREALIANARLRGERHPGDNGIVSPGEIIPRLQAELQAERALADRLGLWLDAVLGDHDKYDLMNADEALAAWKGARNE
jgi:hypothetical protein